MRELAEITTLDIRDAALEGIEKYLESEGHSPMTAMSEGLGLVYVDGAGPLFIVEINRKDR